MYRKLLLGITMGALAALLVLWVSVGIADEDKVYTSGKFRYTLDDGDAAEIVGTKSKLSGDLVIPGEIKKHPVTRIGGYAFRDCTKLRSVTIPDGVSYIGGSAFAGCSSLTSVVIPDSVTVIDSEAFQRCSKLDNVVIPGNIAYIGNYAFSDCSSLTSLVISEGVEGIFNGTFNRSGLTSVTIPASVTKMGDNPFVGCPLESIDVSPDNPTFKQQDGVLLTVTKMTLVAYPNARKGEYTIPDGVQIIGDEAFRDCLGLTSIFMPDSVTDIGEIAFIGCTNLTSVTIPDSVTKIYDGAFDGCEQLTLRVAKDSVAELYALDNKIPFEYTQE